MTYFFKKSFSCALLTSVAFIALSVHAVEKSGTSTIPGFESVAVDPVYYYFPGFATTQARAIQGIGQLTSDNVVERVTGKLGGSSIGNYTPSFTAIKLSNTSYLAQADLGIYRKGVFFSIDNNRNIKVTHARYCILSNCKNRDLTLDDRMGYIATSRQSGGYGIFDLKVTFMSNLALNKPAIQSSTYSHPANPIASKAVDGNTNGIFNNNSVTSTNNEQGAWWQVDLGSAKLIQQIRIFNRTDCCKDRLSNYQVRVSTDADRHDVVYQIAYAGYPKPKKIINFNLQSVIGRYVSIQLLGNNMLALAEVQVFGHNIRHADGQH